MKKSEPKGNPFLLRLAVLSFVFPLAQCSLAGRPHPTSLSPQAQVDEQASASPQTTEGTQVQTLTPQEQLELFNTFADQA